MTILCAALGAAGADRSKGDEEILKPRRLGDKALAGGHHDQAIKFYREYQRAAADDPKLSADAAQCLVTAHLKATDPAEARAELEKLIAAAPELANDSRILLYKGDILSLENKFREAKRVYLDALRRILPIDDLYPRTLAGLGYCQIKLDERGEALKTFAKLQKTGHGTDWAFHALRNKILVLLSMDKLAEARDELERFRESGNKRPAERMRLLTFYMVVNAEKLSEALALYEKIKETEIKTSDIYWFTAISRLAEQLMGKGESKRAAAMLDDAFARAPTARDRQEILRLLINVHAQSGDFDKALETGKRFIEYYGDSRNGYRVRLQMARLLHQRKKIGEALTYYGEITNDAAANEIRVEAAREAAAILVQQKLYEEASKKFDFMFHHAEDASARGEGKYGLAEVHFLRGELERAADLLLDVAKHFPAWREKAIYKAIAALMKLKRHEQAIQLGDLYLKEFPKSKRADDVKFQRALATLNRGNEPLAAKRFTEFLKRNPDHPRAANAALELGNIAFDACEFDKAAKRYDELVVRYPRSAAAPFAIYKSVYAKYLNDDDQGAVDAVERLVASHPESQSTLHALFWLADYYRDLKNFDQAETILARVFDLFKKDPETAAKTFYERAYVCQKAGKIEKALFYLDELTAKYPESQAFCDGLFLAGDLHSREGNYEKATMFYAKAAERKPGSTLESACWGRLGDCNYSLYPKNFDKKVLKRAMSFYEKVLAQKEISSTFRDKTLYSLARCHEFLGSGDEAAAKFREVIFNYDIDREDGVEREPVWMVKSALALVEFYLGRNTPEHAEKGIEILELLIKRGIEPAADYRQRMETIREKYHLK